MTLCRDPPQACRGVCMPPPSPAALRTPERTWPQAPQTPAPELTPGQHCLLKACLCRPHLPVAGGAVAAGGALELVVPPCAAPFPTGP